MLEREDSTKLQNKLTISGHRIDNVAVIDVVDTGPGLPAKAKEHLFSPFQGSTSRNGSGLGLTICEELVNAHGGKITLIDEERGGAHFEIRIPDLPSHGEDQPKNEKTA